ncbi:hypothetical protein JCM11491_006712 [Sporobolomyces phaffii]
MSSSFHHHQHSLSQSSSSSSSLLPATAPSPYALHAANQTRVLLLSDFDPQLKTRDLMDLLAEWEDDRGGFKVKWRDDTSAWIVFTDAATAKRAFLALLTRPPKQLVHKDSTRLHPNVTAYTATDVNQVLAAVQHRPRSHSNAGAPTMHHHSRKASASGFLSGGAAGAPLLPPPSSSSSPGGTQQQQQQQHHARTASWGRNSLDRRAAKDLLETSASMTASALPASNPFSSSSAAAEAARSASPETFSQGHGGIVAGDTPRRIGQGGGGGTHHAVHRRSGSESAASRVAGSTIRE